ncbi:complement decay-accelerating factor isoform X3 [Alexandromys fortis]|uniref:complement decay-accelerating factor isoform X3 n=1 Tax=Alexandromys fortis TaxID=100897 RepID=UPI002153340F|nr:complement decay-accelerating factor isoform X3 [Microtus fortis]
MGSGTRSSPLPPSPLLLSLLPLLLLSPTVRGDCGPPPEIPNATPEVDGKTSFPQQSFVVYSCNKDYQKIPGKQDTVFCLENGQWSSPDTFCNKSCNAPTRVTFASLKMDYINLNYFPIGITVEYECRPGYRRVTSLSGSSTCLDNLEWSTVAEFCKKKSCPNPGELQNGNIDITTDILFGSEIFFSCNTGYKLIGVDSAFCYITGNTVEWSDPLPECVEKSKIPSTTPKSTTVTVPTTRVPLTSAKPTTATQRAPATKTTTHHPIRTTKEKERSTSGGDHLIYGRTCLITLTVLHAMVLLLIG